MRHSDLINPFREILKEKTPWNWTIEHEQAYKNIKEAFVHCVSLSHYIPGAAYKLQTDAPDTGISGILYQYDSNDDHRIVSLVSRCLNVSEMNYTTTEKELLAIVYSIAKLRIYLIGRPFEIITDHKGLTFLNTTVYLNSRLIRWSIVLQQYDFTVSYCKGKNNLVADFFSRNPRGCFEKIQSNDLLIDVLEVDEGIIDNQKSIGQIDLDKDLRNELKNLSLLQQQDSLIKKIIDDVEINKKIEFFMIHEGVLFRKDNTFKTW